MAYDLNKIIAEYGQDDFGFSTDFSTVSEEEYSTKIAEQVKEEEWLTDAPNYDGQDFPENLREKYNFRKDTIKGLSGKWVHSSCNNNTHNKWVGLPCGVSTRVSNRYAINYESDESKRFLVRKVIHIENKDNIKSFKHTTKSSSMYVKNDE